MDKKEYRERQGARATRGIQDMKKACVCYKTVEQWESHNGRPVRPEHIRTNNRYPDSERACGGGGHGGRWGGQTEGARGGRVVRVHQLILSSSTSNRSTELGGITGGKPRAPYACGWHEIQSIHRTSGMHQKRGREEKTRTKSGVAVRTAFSPRDSCGTPDGAMAHD